MTKTSLTKPQRSAPVKFRQDAAKPAATKFAAKSAQKSPAIKPTSGTGTKTSRTSRSSPATSQFATPSTVIEATITGSLEIERISKQAKLIALLSQKSGATLAEMMIVTGWQAHSVRGVLSGVLRKKLGLDVSQRINTQGERIYRIAA